MFTIGLTRRVGRHLHIRDILCEYHREASGDTPIHAFPEDSQSREAVVEGLAIVYVLHRVLYPQVHVNGGNPPPVHLHAKGGRSGQTHSAKYFSMWQWRNCAGLSV